MTRWERILDLFGEVCVWTAAALMMTFAAKLWWEIFTW